MGFCRQQLKWVAISSSRGSSWPRDRTHISCISPVLQADSLLWSPRKPNVSWSRKKSSRWRDYRGRHDLLCLESSIFPKFSILFFSPAEYSLYDISGSLIVAFVPFWLYYRVSLKTFRPELTVLEMCLAPQHCYHLGSATRWVIFWGADGLPPSVHCSAL